MTHVPRAYPNAGDKLVANLGATSVAPFSLRQ